MPRRTTYVSSRHLMRSRTKTREAHLAVFSIVHRHRRGITRIANRCERASFTSEGYGGEGSRRYISYAEGERWDGETEAKANSLHCGVRRGLSLYFAFACLSWLGTCSLEHVGPTKRTRAFLCVRTPYCAYTNAYVCMYVCTSICYSVYLEEAGNAFTDFVIRFEKWCAGGSHKYMLKNASSFKLLNSLLKRNNFSKIYFFIFIYIINLKCTTLHFTLIIFVKI